VKSAPENVVRTITNIASRTHLLSRWHEASTIPFNQDLELRVDDAGKYFKLPFPCRQTNANEWINVDLGTPVRIKPVKWRIWQRDRSPHPHHSVLKLSEDTALAHTHGGIPDRTFSHD
jgi:hypothetical protein